MRFLLAAMFALALACPTQAGAPARKKAEPVPVPYRLTDTQHVLVRVKLNGKGPFNFIVDTGAPVSFVSIPAGKKVGLEKTEKKLAVLDTLQFEGGLTQKDVKIVVDTPFQLEGMNGLGLAGAELHGIIGYTELARYRMEFDFTRDKLLWTPLDFDPPPPMRIGGKGATSSLEMIGGFMKVLGSLSGMKPPEPPTPRGFLGLWLEGKDKEVLVKTVLKGSPAEGGKLEAGDRILKINGKEVGGVKEAHDLTNRVLPGDDVQVLVRRGEKEIELKLLAASGL